MIDNDRFHAKRGSAQVVDVPVVAEVNINSLGNRRGTGNVGGSDIRLQEQGSDTTDGRTDPFHCVRPQSRIEHNLTKSVQRLG